MLFYVFSYLVRTDLVWLRIRTELYSGLILVDLF